MALIPPFFLDCVTAIGIENADGSKDWIGTGFLVGRFFEVENDKNQYHVFIVTNKHVLEDQKSIIVRFNPLPSASGVATDYAINLDNANWIEHPSEDVDVAVISIDVTVLQKQGRKFAWFRSDQDLLRIKEMAESGVSEGDFIYALGFPMGIVDPDRQYVISKGGTIARIRDVLEGYGKIFIADISVFPGNSGSPIVSKPEFTCIQGTKSVDSAKLIGIVNSYIPYTDEAISKQTKMVRVTFEENSGLAKVIPTDFVMETIDLCYEKYSAQGIESKPTSESAQK